MPPVPKELHLFNCTSDLLKHANEINGKQYNAMFATVELY